MADTVGEKPLFGAPATDGGDADSAPKGGEEDCSKEYEPVVQLSEVETKTGEEDELVLFKVRAKLFRFSKELSEWKERGTGDVRILKHRDSRKIRLLMRREKTLKICLNQYVNPEVELGENIGSDRSWVWHGVDYADGERDEALLAIRFRDSDHANQFKKAYDEARDYMEKLKDGKLQDESNDADATPKAPTTGDANTADSNKLGAVDASEKKSADVSENGATATKKSEDNADNAE